MARAEYEYEIPAADAEEILNTLCTGSVIEKTRHFVRHGEHTWEIDVFEGDHSGLVLAEVELPREDETFQRPGWLGREVPGNQCYYNAYLAEPPYRR